MNGEILVREEQYYLANVQSYFHVLDMIKYVLK